MAQAGFAKKLSKELTRNPKKTGALGLCLIVAIWFWVPLVHKWIAPEDNGATTKATETAPATAVANTTAAPEASTDNKTVDINWRKLKEQFSHQPMMASAQLRAEATPFTMAEEQPEIDAEQEEQEGDEGVAPVVGPTYTPQQLGLALASTMIGGDMRLAMINGQACEVGTVLVVPRGSEQIELTLVEIRGDSVMLDNGMEVHELKQAGSASAMQLSQAGAPNTVHIGPVSNGSRKKSGMSQEQQLLKSLLGE